MMEREYSYKHINLYLTLSVSAFLLFMLVSFFIQDGLGFTLDEKILLAFRHPSNLQIPVGHEWLLPVMRAITTLGNVPVIVGVALIIVLLLIYQKEYKFIPVSLLGIIGGSLVDFLLKDFFARGRPAIVPHLVAAQSWSFPSGHSLMSAIIYPTLAIILFKNIKNISVKIVIFSLALLIPVAVGLSRIYLGVHYPTDVLGGWLLGTSWILFFYNFVLKAGIKISQSKFNE